VLPAEQAREDVAQARVDGWQRFAAVDADRLVFVDGSKVQPSIRRIDVPTDGAKTNMTPAYGLARRGRRVSGRAPHEH